MEELSKELEELKQRGGRMKKYIKKPIIIEAIQFTGINFTECKDFIGDNGTFEIEDSAWKAGIAPPVVNIVIHTLEGNMRVNRGDYIIKGIDGEFYPCKPDIFEKTYEEVEE